jgi:hypothetical protein
VIDKGDDDPGSVREAEAKQDRTEKYESPPHSLLTRLIDTPYVLAMALSVSPLRAV